MSNALKRGVGVAMVVSAALCPVAAHAQSAAEGEATWWSYRAMKRPPVPRVGDPSWVSNPIDAYILARLDGAGLRPAAEADRAALIRRATYDLTGLPPTPEEVDAFLADPAPDAYERLLDRLLDSPQYGVKWGRHWLDLVRFAETDSYERDRLKPGAWRYRDYVIDAFNEDKPYDRFVIEQLAGDEIENPTFDTLVATGYYRLGIWDDEPTDVLLAQYDDLDGIIDTTSRVMLATSLACARCHEHKRDPIPQADYYRMLAFFTGIKPYKEGGGNNVAPQNFVKPVPTDLGSDAFGAVLARHEAERAHLRTRMEEIRDRTLATLSSQAKDRMADEARVGLRQHFPFDTPDVFRDRMSADKIEVFGDPVTTAGRSGTALMLDGRDDYLRIPRKVGDDFSIAFWFRTNHVGPGTRDYRWFVGSGLVDAEVRGITNDFGISYHSDGRITAGTGRPETFLTSESGHHDDRWHQVVFTRERSSGAIALYLDGTLSDTATGSNEALTATEFLDVGRMHPGYNPFKGALDDLRIYDRVLDPGEVLTLYYGSGFEEALQAGVQLALGDETFLEYQATLDAMLALRRPVRPTEDVLCVMENVPAPATTFVLVRGNPHTRGDKVGPGVPGVLSSVKPVLESPAPDAESSGRRLALAKWIVDPANVRSARVMANRIWQYHFGRGIVRSSNDFGRLGTRPTHPELLDWLAAEFVEGGWRLKRMHRLIMTSSTYRMSCQADPNALAIDATNDLFWRFDMRRLTAEEIRDSILAASGALNLKMGGPGVFPEMPPEVLATSSRPDEVWGKSIAEEAARRSVYIHVKRSLLSPLLSTFDLADTDSSCPVRFVTTQPTQALNLLNSAFTQAQAQRFARRLREEAGNDPKRQVDRALRLLLGRAPGAAEIEGGLDFMESLEAEGVDPQDRLKYFCLMGLNLNEFVYLD